MRNADGYEILHILMMIVHKLTRYPIHNLSSANEFTKKFPINYWSGFFIQRPTSL